MKVLRVRPDVHRYPYLIPAPGQDLDGADMVFDGRSRAWNWSHLHAGFRPKGKDAPDFAKLGHGAMVLSPRALKLTQHILERAGELLSVHVDDQEYTLLNVTQVVDCLDPAKTEWFEVQGKAVHVKRYAFRPTKLPAANVFKVPEQARDRFFTISGRASKEVELQSVVEGAGLRGLVFEEVWCSSGPSPS